MKIFFGKANVIEKFFPFDRNCLSAYLHQSNEVGRVIIIIEHI
jgi:hypothetical protein